MKTFDFGDTGGLFDHYEINREPFWPRVWWWLAGSGVWHLLLIVCIIMIPPLRDAFSIAALFASPGFVDRPYNRSEIADADIIEFPQEKFHYPEGYFAMDQQAMPPASQFPTIPTFKPQPVALMASPTPTATPSAVPTATPSPLIASNAGKPSDAKPSPSPSTDKAAEQAQKDLEAAAKKTGIDLPQEGDINKAPFKDLAAYATQLRDTGKLDFDQAFEISIDTTLDKDGKLVNPTVSRKSGNDTLIDLAKRLVAAMNDSGVLFYLKKINNDRPNTKVIFTIKQEGNDVVATVESEVASPDSARVLSNDFALMLAAGALTRKGKDEEVLLKKTKVTADGNKVVFNLTLPHRDVVDIVKKGTEAASPSATPS